MPLDSNRQSAEEFHLRELISRRLTIDVESILTFSDFELFLPDLIRNYHSPKSQLIAAAPVIASVAIAADRAEMKLVTAESNQPFAGETESIKKEIKSEHDLVYLANPNRLSGCSYSIKDINEIAGLIEKGLLIIDEYYFDFSKISAVSLLETLKNVIIVRPFEKWTNAGQLGLGYALFNQEYMNRFTSLSAQYSLNDRSAGKCSEIFENAKEVLLQVESLHKRALAIAKELSALGIDCRITPTNMVLFNLKASGVAKEIPAINGLEAVSFEDGEVLNEYARYVVTGTEKDREFVAELAESKLRRAGLIEAERNRIRFEAAKFKAVYD